MKEKELEKFPDDAVWFAYEGEVIGVGCGLNNKERENSMSKISEMMDYLKPATDENGSPVLQHEYDRLKAFENFISEAKPVAWMNIDSQGGAMFFRSPNTINAVPLIVMPNV